MSRKYTIALLGFGVLVVIAVGFFIVRASDALWASWFTAFIANIAQYGVVNVGQKATAKPVAGEQK